jgi:hypothetical protein
LHHESVSFFLQRFYVKQFTENLMLHLLVEDVDVWWSKISAGGITKIIWRQNERSPSTTPAKARLHLLCPTGVLWRIARNNA